MDIFGADIGDGSLRVVIGADPAPADDPIRVRFDLSTALLAPRTDATQVEVAFEGQAVADCADPTNADPAPCVEARGPSAAGLEILTRSTVGGEWTIGVPARCAPTPLEACAPAAKSPRLVVKDGRDSKDAIVWIWPKGDDDLTPLGDPVATDHHAMCVYNAAGELLAHSRIVAQDDCDGSPCWKAKPTEDGALKELYLFKDRTSVADGVNLLKLKADARGRKSLGLKAKGPAIALADLPLALPVELPIQVQLQSHTGACWQSTFETEGVKKNDGNIFKATGR